MRRFRDRNLEAARIIAQNTVVRWAAGSALWDVINAFFARLAVVEKFESAVTQRT